ncbi:hypothetical protein COCON_G00072610 [Conger conger]|uniref:Uncharacterized protein n=1 Tax=Conger conger TaxID=82655 RepID=A0A9Q1I041_CONCO|nr:hypothetical protein COCON_G00072610 [Conger conger]
MVEYLWSNRDPVHQCILSAAKQTWTDGCGDCVLDGQTDVRIGFRMNRQTDELSFGQTDVRIVFWTHRQTDVRTVFWTDGI